MFRNAILVLAIAFSSMAVAVLCYKVPEWNKAVKESQQVEGDLSATISCIGNTAYTRPMIVQCIEDWYAAAMKKP